MITKEYSNKGIHFKSHFNGQILPFNEWMKTDDSIYYQPLSILIDNGYAEDCGDGCLVPYENIYQLNDTEKIPQKQDINEYFDSEVLPYAPDAWMDRSKDKLGVEFPFTRLFYVYRPLRSSEEILAELNQLDKELDNELKALKG